MNIGEIHFTIRRISSVVNRYGAVRVKVDSGKVNDWGIIQEQGHLDLIWANATITSLIGRQSYRPTLSLFTQYEKLTVSSSRM